MTLAKIQLAWVIPLTMCASLAGCAPREAAPAVASAPQPAPCNPAGERAETKSDEKTLHVDSAEVDCSGVGPRTCLRVKQEGEPEFETFYASIEGFQFVPGYSYILRVRQTEKARAVADASRLRYELVSVVEKNPAGLSLENSWVPREADQDSPVVLKFEKERLSGSSGVNRFHAQVEIEGTELSIGPMAVTRRAGPPALMQREQEFLARLEKAASYRIVGEELRLLDGHRKVLLTFRPGDV